MKLSMEIYTLSLALALFANGCSGTKSTGLAAGNDRLSTCPDRPNCVSSEAQDAKHSIEPFLLKGDPAAAWDAIRDVVGSLPRCTIIKATDRYLHAECRSRLFGFVDDLELQLDQVSGAIAIRSASRIGYSDLGVNRRRVETLRQKLRKEALIQ